MNIALALVISISAQHPQFTSPAELIQYLTYQSERPDRHLTLKGEQLAFSCGTAMAEERDNRALTERLIEFGPAAALPALEQALDAFPNGLAQAHFILEAYARLKGPQAYARLHSLYGTRWFQGVHSAQVDQAIAKALGLTSYVSGHRPARDSAPIFHCDATGASPSEALDQFIAKWIVSHPNAGIGYRFEPSPRNTIFYTRTLRACGRQRLRFETVPGFGSFPSNQLDSRDTAKLTRLLDKCAKMAPRSL